MMCHLYGVILGDYVIYSRQLLGLPSGLTILGHGMEESEVVLLNVGCQDVYIVTLEVQLTINSLEEEFGPQWLMVFGTSSSMLGI